MNKLLNRHPDARTKILPDGHIVLQLKNADWVHVLTPTGGIVWEFADGTADAEEIASLVDTIPELPFDKDREQQILELISELSSKGLLVHSEYNSRLSTADDGSCTKDWEPKKNNTQKSAD